MSKKIAFSIWPRVDSNEEVPPGIVKLQSESAKVLESHGFEVVFNTELVDTNDPYIDMMLDHFKPTKRMFTHLSDYLRVKMVREYQETYDEVLYFDADLLILEPPKTYGCAIETHMQQDEMDGPINKLWMKAVNCAYFFNNSEEHKEAVQMHLDWITEYIENNKGKCKYAYAQALMAPVEDGVGLIENYWLFGPLSEPLFCSPKKIIECMVLYYLIYGRKPEGIHACNMMGSRTDDFKDDIEIIKGLNSKYQEVDLDEGYINSILAHFNDTKVRIRPNYNSDRSHLKNFIAKNSDKFESVPYTKYDLE